MDFVSIAGAELLEDQPSWTLCWSELSQDGSRLGRVYRTPDSGYRTIVYERRHGGPQFRVYFWEPFEGPSLLATEADGINLAKSLLQARS